MDWKEWHRELSDTLGCEYLERTVTLEKARELVDRLAQYESQCIPRTADMPEWARMWIKVIHPAQRPLSPRKGMPDENPDCFFVDGLGTAAHAPDLLPDEPGPIYRHIVDVE